MSRDLTASMLSAIEAPVIRPVLIAYLDIASDPIAMWTGAGTFQPTGSADAVLNGKSFSPASAFADMSEILENEGIGGPITVILRGHSLDADALRQIVRDRRQWRGRKAYFWLGLLNEQLNAVYEYPVRIKTGIMTRVVVSRGTDDVSIELTVDEDLQNAKTAAFRLTDHARIHSGDTFSAFVIELANKPGGLERTNPVTMSDWERNNGFKDDGVIRDQY